MKKFLFFAILSMPICGITARAFGQAAILQSERVTGSLESVSVSLEGIANGSAGYLSNTGFDSDETLAHSNCYSLSGGASVMMSGDASNSVAIGNSDFVPTVDTTMQIDAGVDPSDPYAGGWWTGLADAGGRFEVISNPSMPTTTTGDMVSNVYLVALRTVSSWYDFSIQEDWLRGRVANLDVRAFNFGGPDWYVELYKPSAPPEFIYVPGGLNNLYRAWEPVTVGTIYEERAAINSGVQYAGNPDCDGSFDMSASAWCSIHPSGSGPGLVQ